MNKEERAAEALRRRAEQVEELRRRQDEEKKKREDFNKEGKQELREMERASRYSIANTLVRCFFWNTPENREASQFFRSGKSFVKR